MPTSRRQFLATAATGLVALPLISNSAGATSAQPRTGHTFGAAPDPHALAARAIEAARAAGATYADVRLTVTRRQVIRGTSVDVESEGIAAGVRTLVNGYWGFESSTRWTTDEMARIARAAVAQATESGNGTHRPIELGAAPTNATGEWRTPITIDPFDIPLTEKIDFINAVQSAANNYAPGIRATMLVELVRQQKFFASTEGASWSQTTYESGGDLQCVYRAQPSLSLFSGSSGIEFLSLAGKGWEYIVDPGIWNAIPALVDRAEEARHRVRVYVDRGNAVFSANAMATILDATLGTATELDRAMGFEANADGTSYLNDPVTMAGRFPVGTPLLTVTANRSMPGGAATVKWDDDSITPDDFTLIKNGVLTDYQTTRESAAWLAPYDQRIGRPTRSHGCASSASALDVPLQMCPNLQMQPVANGPTFDEMVSRTVKGVAILSVQLATDQQQLNGLGDPVLREIVGGKLGRYVDGAGLQFRTSTLWKNITAVGGPSTVQWFGLRRGKGQPQQVTTHSVGAVPAMGNNVDIIDIVRKI